MDKRDLPFFVLLLVLILAWPAIDRHWVAPRFRPSPPAVPAEEAPASTPAQATQPTPSPANDVLRPSMDEPASSEPPVTVTLSNQYLRLTFSNRGAAVTDAILSDYRMTLDPDSGPVHFDFSDFPTLSYEGLQGLGESYGFAILEQSAQRLVIARTNTLGLALIRTVEVGTSYVVRVRDQFVNTSTATVAVAAPRIRLGPMGYLPGESRSGGFEYLGIDTLSPGERVTYWGSKLARYFDVAGGPSPQIVAPLLSESRPAEWVAVKNKYFAQILKPLDDRFERVSGRLRRAAGESGRRVRLESVAAVMSRSSRNLDSGEVWTAEYELFVGPKKYDILRQLDAKRADVLEFGRLSGVAKLLLATLNASYQVVPNYGVAILVLTVLIRILFWPLTHRSTESMKRMQALQPQVQEIQRRYKDQPQRAQKEILALYRAHKVNPLSGCLPILVQLPVLFALFVVLRSAIELRFAPFLWIRDLSEPENLLHGRLPFGLSLNPLPIVMTALQVWQSALTPSSGDPAQQKMFMIMPVLFVFFFYNFPSGLVLYWTASQALMIVQLLRQRRAAQVLGRAEK